MKTPFSILELYLIYMKTPTIYVFLVKYRVESARPTAGDKLELNRIRQRFVTSASMLFAVRDCTRERRGVYVKLREVESRQKK